MDSQPTLGIIGGSGLYNISGLEDIQEHDLQTPYGKPSAPIITGRLKGKQVAFLARHGIGHHISPSEIPFRANIYALKSLGVEQVVSISASGSLREDYAPGDMVVPDQLFDFTRDRKRTYFEDGLVAHINVAQPFCIRLSQRLYQAAKATEARAHSGGSFITVEGPRFSTKAESHTFRAWGMSIIGMTTAPEAFLAREAELCYAVLAHVTDYDVWHTAEAPVTVEMVIEILNRNQSIAQQAIYNLLVEFQEARDCECPHALASAIITQRDRIPPETRNRLSLFVDEYLA
ncbi:MAG TPA: S-methyl-5'-thioadenosine phosphorylase [Anaerolineales bacterium]|nr:S-methyl-5'-thioadenosine phosphorylase [Anaerolineales bacterium]